MNEKFYMYRGYPLVRNDNMIYYGYMSDPYVIMMQIMTTKKIGDEEVADKVRVIQMSTDPTLDPLKASAPFMRAARTNVISVSP